MSSSHRQHADGRYDAHAAAHDVNNLLHVILGCCDRLRGGLTPSQTEELDHIAMAAEHAAALASRVLGSRTPTEVGTIDLRTALQRLQGLLRRIAGDTIDVTFRIPDGSTPVRLHEGDLAQVLVNLTVNARDAMPNGGRLLIDAGIAGDRHVQLRVADNGVGMTESVRARVFERFFTTKANEGTGHGLAIVRSIVDRYGGTIELRSEPGQGAEFTIVLPIIERRRDEVASAEASVEAAGTTAGSGPAAGPAGVSFIDSLPTPAFVLQDGRFAYVNQAFCALLALPGDDLVGHSALERVHPDDRSLFPAYAASAATAQDQPAGTHLRVRGGDGVERTVAVSAVQTQHNGAPALLGAAIDVTLPPDTLTIAARMAALGRLAGGIAHDYNNLLLVIDGHLERLRSAVPAGDELRRDVDAIESAAARAGALTDKLLSFGRGQLLAPQVVDLGAAVARAVDDLQLDSAIQLRVERADDVPAIGVDTSRLREVLWHLVENARDAMPAGGTLTLAVDTVTVDRNLQTRWTFLSPGSLFVRLRVIDSGRGMAPDVAAHAFEPFFTTKGKGKGAGMGLASVYGIVKQSGGYVFVERTDEQGTCMTVLFPPVASSQPVEPPVPSRLVDASPAVPRNRILLVEDTAEVRELLVDVLRNNGYEVKAAESAEEASEQARHAEFDLLLTDLDLPVMSGAQLASTLLTDRPGLRVIIMSGYPDDGSLDAALRQRTEFLRKPFTSQTLLARVTDALALSSPVHRTSSPSAPRKVLPAT